MIDSNLIERCRHGDPNAQRAVYEATSERIYRTILRITGNADDALELAQETYFRAFSRFAQFDGRSTVSTWLYRIAVNEALQFLRRARTLRLTLEDRSREPGRTEPDPATGSDRKIDVEAALATLSDPDRTILHLRYGEQLDYRTIADVLECSGGTVASRLNRAREHLKAILEKGYGNREEPAREVHPKHQGT